MAADESFLKLLQRLETGDDGAAREVFSRYVWRLHALARTQIDRRLAHKIEPEDVVQSAYKSFFLRHRDGKLNVGNRKSLWTLLTLITLRKCADRVEHIRAARRDVSREAERDADDSGAWALDREPDPHEAAVLAETVERLFEATDVHERPVLELSLQGCTVPEICEQLGRAERSVRRLRERIRQRLERMQAEA